MGYSIKQVLKRGFSLLEVLVSVTILAVIVAIMGGIFQQTSVAWSVALKNASDQTSVRSAIGLLSRDLSMAIDPRHFTPSGLGETPEFDAGKLHFYITAPVSLLSSNQTTDSPERELQWIEYSATGGKLTRKVFRVDQDLMAGAEISKSEIELKDADGGIELEPLVPAGALYPDSVTVILKPKTPSSIEDYDIGVESAGPDGVWDTDDDISSLPQEDM